jgi:tetratricopeptide (TPR) repeat protein
VVTANPIDPAHFVETLQPLLEREDLQGLVSTLKANWTCEQVRQLLRGNHADAKKVALLALAWVGKRETLEHIAPQLRDPDPVVNGMAEHAMWSVWFRLGSNEANHELARGTQDLNAKNFDDAVEHFSKSIELDPSFAEAYNQRAIVHYLCERYAESAADCHAAVKRMPCHFGAWAGMGHCYVHLGKLDDALRSYERALEINPHMECVRQTVEEIRGRGRG